jgi:N-acetylglutamate synthase-like GNAT family acetyltransferase
MMKENGFDSMVIHADHQLLPSILKPSIGDPTDEKIKQVIASYDSPNHLLIGSFYDDKLVGVIGVKVLAQEKIIIRHISVCLEMRKQGIGRKLIEYVKQNLQVNHIIAETDEEAVDFYQKIGFMCEEFRGKYGLRYRCQMEVDKSD